MALNFYKMLSYVGFDQQWTRRWYQKRILAPASRRYTQILGIPIIAVTGTNGKTTVTRLLERILREEGHDVGMSCTDGVARGGLWVASGDNSGVLGLALAMKGGGADVLVAETARGGILKFDIGFRHCQVAVVTNVSDDHLGLDGVDTVDQMAEVKARVVDRIAPEGFAVLNADDVRVAAMARRVPGRAIYFSMRRPPPEVCPCVFLEDGRIFRRSAEAETAVIAARDVAITQGGILQYNLANVMAALAALEGLRPVLSVANDAAIRVLTNWIPDANERPFTLRLIEFEGDHILITHSKNPASYAEDMKAIRALRRVHGYETIVGLLTHVGNRTDDFHRAIAESAASACDYLTVVVPEERYLRGRSPESFIAALESGIPRQKHLPSREGDCADLIEQLREGFPGKTLFVLFAARQQRGIAELRLNGREICNATGCLADRALQFSGNPSTSVSEG